MRRRRGRKKGHGKRKGNGGRESVEGGKRRVKEGGWGEQGNWGGGGLSNTDRTGRKRRKRM